MFIQPSGLLGFARAYYDQRQLLDFKWFNEVIQSTEPHGFDCARHAAFGSHHNDAGICTKSLLFQQRGASAIWQVHVEQCKIEPKFRERLARGGQGAGLRDIRAERFQVGGDLLPQQRFVLHYQDVKASEQFRRHGALMPQAWACRYNKKSAPRKLRGRLMKEGLSQGGPAGNIGNYGRRHLRR